MDHGPVNYQKHGKSKRQLGWLIYLAFIEVKSLACGFNGPCRHAAPHASFQGALLETWDVSWSKGAREALSTDKHSEITHLSEP